LLIHCALHAWVRIPSSSGRALKGLCCLSQTSIRGHFRDYITSVQLLQIRMLIHCALHAWVRIPSSSGRALKGLCCLSQTSIRGHFRDYITSVQLLTFHTFPFW